MCVRVCVCACFFNRVVILFVRSDQPYICILSLWRFLRTVQEYLWILRLVCETLEPMNRYSMLYLSAAVSDFYIPDKDLATHKLQEWHLEIQKVPKCLSMIRDFWAPHCFCVSFKLETDHDKLSDKAKYALRSYGVHAVVANELHSRYEQVELYLEVSV